jgi:hypothetical protein
VVTWRVTSEFGGSAEAAQTVTVLGSSVPPGLAAPAPIEAVADAGQCSASLSPVAPSPSGGCGTVTVSGARSDGAALSAPYPVGNTTITWTAVDESGITASVTQSVTVSEQSGAHECSP